MNKTNLLQIFVFLLLIFSINLANNKDATTPLEDALQSLCITLYSLIGSLSMVMVMMSSIVYTGGQMFGAEMRARSHVWSQSLLSGAIIGILMVLIIPSLLGVMLGMSFDASSCTFN